MSGIHGIFNTARVALSTQQMGIEITGNNIANVNTPGYSRQRVNLVTSEPVLSTIGSMGTGVEVKEIQRIYDQFLSAQINEENSKTGRWESKRGALEKTEMIFDAASGSGLSQRMSEFWNGWQDLANNPIGQTERVALVAKSETMILSFNQVSSDLQQTQQEMNVSIKGTVENINLLTTQIADFNYKIASMEAESRNANNYRDQQELLIKDLSLLMDIKTFENSNGATTVLTGTGRALVENVFTSDLAVIPNTNGFYDVGFIDKDGTTTDISMELSGGKLKGWLDARDEIAGYLASLDTMAGTLITQVNTLHQGGFDLAGAPGEVFFAGTTAADIAVNSNIINDPNLVAAASATAHGDNTNALAIADLQNTPMVALGTTTFDDYYNSIVNNVGTDVKEASSNHEHQLSMMNHLDDYRESVSGVSLDEEMVNMIKFQHAYDASAKMIQVADDMLDTLLRMI